MQTKLSALTLVATVLAVGCNGASQDDTGMGGDGIAFGDTDDMDPTESESDADADSDSDSDSGSGNGFPDTGDGNDSDGVVPTCGGERVLLSSARPSVMLLLDKSGSMVDNAWDHDGDDSTEAVNRWTSLHDVTSNLLGTYADTVDFGAVLFPAADAEVLGNAGYDATFQAACRMSDDAEVAVAPGTREAILAAMPGRDASFEACTLSRWLSPLSTASRVGVAPSKLASRPGMAARMASRVPGATATSASSDMRHAAWNVAS
jgi:hypothetical protein